MHISLPAWSAACAILPLASAFYPYEPRYGDDSSSNSKRAARTNTLPSSNQRQHGIEKPRSITLPLRRVPVPIRPRENTYNIVNNADPEQKNSVAIDQDGTDLSYMVAVTIGSSQEEYHLLLDSAASNTWVMSEDCGTDACGRHNTFGEGDSSTLKIEDTTFSITYGTGSVSGTIASDTVHIGGSLSPTLTFGLATNVSSEFSSYPMDGILGIGRGDTVSGTIEAPQLINVLSSSNLIDAKLYGVHLSRTADGTNDGELNFGSVNKDRFDGDINYLSAVDNDDGFWEIPIADAGADSTLLSLASRSAIIDTGTSFILMPEPDAVALHKLIDGSTQSGETFTVPCDTDKALQIKFGSVTYDVSTKDWVGGTLDTGGCKSNVIGRQTFGETQWLVGDVFLKNVYTVFDFDNAKVGFGVQSGGDSEPEESASTLSPTATASGGESSSPTSTTVMATGTDTAAPTGGASATAGQGFQPSPTSGTANPSAAAAGEPSASASAEGGVGRASTPSACSFALSIALGLLALFG